MVIPEVEARDIETVSRAFHAGRPNGHEVLRKETPKGRFRGLGDGFNGIVPRCSFQTLVVTVIETDAAQLEHR